MTPPTLLALATMLLLGGCTAPHVMEVSASHPAEARVEGYVSVVGSAPMNVRVVLQPREGGGTYRLVGPLTNEVKQLAGFLVTVEGETRDAPPPEARALHVTRYKFASPWGTPLTVGEVSDVSGGEATLRLEGGAVVRVLLPEGAVISGQKVWVEPVDPRAPEPLRILRYGVLRR